MCLPSIDFVALGSGLFFEIESERKCLHAKYTIAKGNLYLRISLLLFMPEFHTTRGITSKIENIISDAKDILVLISPYLSFIPESYLIRIEKALQRKVKVVLVFRDFEGIHENEMDKLESLEGIELFMNPDVHAKAYFNEKDAIITSFNISSRSEANNIEFGISINRDELPDIYERIVRESDLVVTTSIPFSFDQFEGEEFVDEDDEGFCIRCSAKIDFDISRPYCLSCWQIWRQREKPNLKEKYCHVCGTLFETSINSPTCSECKP